MFSASEIIRALKRLHKYFNTANIFWGFSMQQLAPTAIGVQFNREMWFCSVRPAVLSLQSESKLYTREERRYGGRQFSCRTEFKSSSEGVSTVNENWGRRVRQPGMECSREYIGPTLTDSRRRSVFRLGFGLKANIWRVPNCYTLSRTVRFF